MRCSRRLPDFGAMAMKRVDDFGNAIYAVEQNDDGDVAVSIDFQHYFRPFLDAGEWDDRPFPKFVDRAMDYFRGEFEEWFDKFRRSEVA